MILLFKFNSIFFLCLLSVHFLCEKWDQGLSCEGFVLKNYIFLNLGGRASEWIDRWNERIEKQTFVKVGNGRFIQLVSVQLSWVRSSSWLMREKNFSNGIRIFPVHFTTFPFHRFPFMIILSDGRNCTWKLLWFYAFLKI